MSSSTWFMLLLTAQTVAEYLAHIFLTYTHKIAALVSDLYQNTRWKSISVIVIPLSTALSSTSC